MTNSKKSKAMPKTQNSLRMRVSGRSLGIARDQNYTAWSAIAEWVDNAVQSYLDNKKELKKAYKAEGKDGLEVGVHYSPGNKLVITDNGSGMNYNDIDLAFDHGQKKKRKDNDLGQNNAGMKNACMWMCDDWEIRTTKIGSDTEHTVKINTNDIIDDDLILDHSVKECAKEEHYTVLTMTNHWPERKWPANTQKKVRKYLASIYKYFILDKELTITWGESGLLEPKVLLVAKRDTDQTEYKWIIDEAEGEGAETADGEEKRITVKGWLALLEPYSTAGSKGLDKSLCSGRSNAGISIYRRNRMIQGYPDAWKPGCIFGEENPGTNNTVNQRVFGELFIDAAKVSQDKASITHEDLDIIEDYLKEEYKDNAIRAAAIAYVSEGEKPTKDKSKQAVKKVKKKLQESDIPIRITDTTPNDEILDSETKNLFAMLKNEEKEKMKVLKIMKIEV